MIPKSGYRFSEKIMLNEKLERDDDSKKVIPLQLQAPRQPKGVCGPGRGARTRNFAHVLGGR
jgi:hypothetical protein